MLFHTSLIFFFLRHLVKPTTPWKQQHARAEAAQNKDSEPQTEMLGYRRGWLSGFRPVAIQKVHCVNVDKFCSTCIAKNRINTRTLWLFLPWAFCVFIRALCLHFLIIWLLFWHFYRLLMNDYIFFACARMGNSFLLSFNGYLTLLH